MKKILFSFVLFFFSSAHAALFTLQSNAFNDREALSPVYTCEGKNISPDLSWKYAPVKTISFALILSDPDAPHGIFYHWVLFNIPKTTSSLSKNISKLPAETQTGKNSWGKSQYNGPCPPKGLEHHYIFSLYALNTKLDIPADADAKAVLNAMQNHVLAETELKATFRMKQISYLTCKLQKKGLKESFVLVCQKSMA